MEHSLYTQQTAGLEWVGPLAFARQHPGPPGVDLDLGDAWGARGDQRVSWRHDLDADVGLLYAYDAMWDEFAVLVPRVSRGAVAEAYLQATHDPRVTTVEAFADLTRRVRLTPSSRVEQLGLEPEL